MWTDSDQIFRNDFLYIRYHSIFFLISKISIRLLQHIFLLPMIDCNELSTLWFDLYRSPLLAPNIFFTVRRFLNIFIVAQLILK